MQEIGRLEKAAINDLLATKILLGKREAEVQQLKVKVQNLTAGAAKALNGLSGQPVAYKHRRMTWIIDRSGPHGLTVTPAVAVSAA